MCAGAIALMPGKSVFGEFQVDTLHESVPCHLRNHAGGGDGHGEPVAFHEGLVRHREPLHRQAVDQGDVGALRERRKRQPHRTVRGAQDVDPIDILRADHFHSPNDLGIPRDLGIKEIPALFRELLGIVEKGARKRPGKYDRRRCDRPGQRSTPRLVDTGHPAEAACGQCVFVGEIRHVSPFAVEAFLQGQVGGAG